MIQKPNPQKFPRLLQSLSDFPVFRAGLDVARWVVMADYDAGDPVGYDVGENFPRVDNSTSYLINFFSDSR